MHKIPNGTDMIFQLLGERQGFAYQTRDTLAQSTIEAFDVTGLASVLTAGAMALCGKNSAIRGPEIGVGDGALAVNGRQGLPQTAGTAFVTRADIHAHDFAGVHIQGQPNPLFVGFVLDKGPQFITFNGQPAFFFADTCTCWGTRAYLSLT